MREGAPRNTRSGITGASWTRSTAFYLSSRHRGPAWAESGGAVTQLLRRVSLFVTASVMLLGLALSNPPVVSAQGWYLMAPPWRTTIKEGEDELDTMAPLTKWEQKGAFDTARICETSRLGIVQNLEKGDKERLDRAAQSWLRQRPGSDPLQTKEGEEYARYRFALMQARASRCV